MIEEDRVELVFFWQASSGIEVESSAHMKVEYDSQPSTT